MEAVEKTPEREAFYKKIDGENLSARWNVMGEVLRPHPLQIECDPDPVCRGTAEIAVQLHRNPPCQICRLFWRLIDAIHIVSMLSISQQE